MELRNHNARIYVPDSTDIETAIRRTTHLAVGAHQDDIPIMAYDGIRRCFCRTDRWFLAVTVTDGAGSPRAGAFADYSDEQMRDTRADEENRAGAIGGYAAVIQLGYSSDAARDGQNNDVVADLVDILSLANPDIVYTHNPTDKHDTHVAAVLRTVAAVRELPAGQRPQRLYGGEVWRGLDWLVDDEKVIFDYTDSEHLFSELMSAYQSQIAGGKRYDLASAARWLGNATFLTSHRIDRARAVGLAMDLTPLIEDTDADVATYVSSSITRMGADVASRIARLG